MSEEDVRLLGRKRAFDSNRQVLSLVDSAGHYEHDGNDKSVKGEGLGEDHHEDEGNKDILLSISTYTSITNNTNGQTSSKG